MKKSSTKEILYGSATYAGFVALFTLIGFAIMGFTGVFKYSQTQND